MKFPRLFSKKVYKKNYFDFVMLFVLFSSFLFFFFASGIKFLGKKAAPHNNSNFRSRGMAQEF